MSGATARGPGLDLVARVPGRLDVALRAAPGEVVAVIGPNGAGKSTLLHAVAGLTPHEGHVRVGEEDWTTWPVARRRLGMVFQDRLLFPHLTALDNVAFGPRARGVPRATAAAHARAWLDRLGVGDLAGRRPAELSGGQAQRVALARALVGDPSVLLLDEPMGALDVSVVTRLRHDLLRHLREFGGTTLLVTHEPVDALTLADTVVVLEAGRVEQVGSPAEVTQRPRTDHVARLVGLNIHRGLARGTTVALDDGRLLQTTTAHEGPAYVAFSPTAVSLSLSEPAGSARNRWRGQVRGLAPHGGQVRVLVEVSPDSQVIADITPAAATELGLAPGAPVWLALKATETRVYPVA